MLRIYSIIEFCWNVKPDKLSLYFSFLWGREPTFSCYSMPNKFPSRSASTMLSRPGRIDCRGSVIVFKFDLPDGRICSTSHINKKKKRKNLKRLSVHWTQKFDVFGQAEDERLIFGPLGCWSQWKEEEENECDIYILFLLFCEWNWRAGFLVSRKGHVPSSAERGPNSRLSFLSSSPAIVFLLLAEKRSQVEERHVVCDELKSATRTPPSQKYKPK